MKAHTRGFMAFDAVGCLAAGGVGWGVWRASAPSDVSVSDTATTQTNLATDSTTSVIPSEVKTSTSETAPADGAVSDQGSVLANDPFLAPNAYIAAPNRGRQQATRFFTPTNQPITTAGAPHEALATPVAPEPTSIGSTAASTPASTASTPTESTAPSTTDAPTPPTTTDELAKGPQPSPESGLGGGQAAGQQPQPQPSNTAEIVPQPTTDGAAGGVNQGSAGTAQPSTLSPADCNLFGAPVTRWPEIVAKCS